MEDPRAADADFRPALGLKASLALFLLLEGRSGGIAGSAPELDRLEDELRDYLYGNLSIADMENPGKTYSALAGRKERA